MKNEQPLLFLSIMIQEEDGFDVAWIVTKPDRIELQRRQYAVKPIVKEGNKKLDAYFSPFVIKAFERTISLYSPVCVVFSQEQINGITHCFGIGADSVREIILLDSLARDRGVTGFLGLESLQHMIGLKEEVAPFSSIRQVEALRTCYFQLIDRNLSARALVKEVIGHSGKRILDLWLGKPRSQSEGTAIGGGKPAPVRYEQKGCFQKFWDILMAGMALFIVISLLLALLVMLFRFIEWAISLFR